MREDWEDEASPELSGRPPDVSLVVKLLAGSVAFHALTVFELWSRLEVAGALENRAAWIRPAVLFISAVLLALMWKGNSQARNLILVAIAWDVLGFSA